MGAAVKNVAASGCIAIVISRMGLSMAAIRLELTVPRERQLRNHTAE